jgi:hypothetical protein
MNYKSYLENEKRYAEYLKNKKVIIVGPGDLLLNAGLGSKIDNYDIVVRLNNSYPINCNNSKYHNDIGKRTDILYHTGAINTVLHQEANRNKTGRIELLQKDNLKWFVSKRDPIYGSTRDKNFLGSFIKINNLYNKKYKPQNKIKIVPVWDKFLFELQKVLGNTDPNMSTLAVSHLLTFQIKKLEIVGCDFYSGGYHPFYAIPRHIKWNDKTKTLDRKDGKKRRTPVIPHSYKNQIDFLIKMIENDKRVYVKKSILNKWKKHLV